MAIPEGGTDAVKNKFENLAYVREVFKAFKDGDDDTLYAMRGLFLLDLQFRSGTRCREFRDGKCMHTHTHTRARTLARTHAHIYQILQILYLISFQFAQVRQPKRMEKVTSAIVTVVLKDHKIARGTRQPSTWFATHTGIRVYVKRGSVRVRVRVWYYKMF